MGFSEIPSAAREPYNTEFFHSIPEFLIACFAMMLAENTAPLCYAHKGLEVKEFPRYARDFRKFLNLHLHIRFVPRVRREQRRRRKAHRSSNQVARELRLRRVVLPHALVVMLTCKGNAIFRGRDLLLQEQELLRGL